MKVCAACSQSLSKDKFSKKQWQFKQQRRCKECISANREAKSDVPPNDAPLPASDSGGKEGASDEDLFKKPPPRGDCDVCFEIMPLVGKGGKYMACCGKLLCTGCIYAAGGNQLGGKCPFCRTPDNVSDKEWIERLKKRVETGDAHAHYVLGGRYSYGGRGMQQDDRKALKLWLRAVELGDTMAYHNIANAYYNGTGVEKDEKKAEHYWELGAMEGDVYSRDTLGQVEAQAGTMERAVKHWMIAAGDGFDNSLQKIQQGYLEGFVTKGDFEKSLRAHKEAKDEVRTDQREAAAAALGFTY